MGCKIRNFCNLLHKCSDHSTMNHGLGVALLGYLAEYEFVHITTTTHSGFKNL
jgi:hypothetical protein